MNNQFPKLKISPFALIFLIVQAFVAIIIISIIVNVKKPEEIAENDTERQPRLLVEGLENVEPSLPDSSMLDIQKGLLSIAKYNNQNINTIDAVGIVRPESLRTYQFEEQDLYFVSAVIDIPELGQSYQVFHDYTYKKENPYYNYYFATVAVCNSGIVENIYPDFECKDLHDKIIYGEIVKKYLSYLKFDGINVSFADDSLSTIEIFLPIPGQDEATKKTHVKRVKEKIESLGIPGDHFTYKVIDNANLNFENR